jgi:hypothetical protein
MLMACTAADVADAVIQVYASKQASSGLRSLCTRVPLLVHAVACYRKRVCLHVMHVRGCCTVVTSVQANKFTLTSSKIRQP